MFVRIDRIRQTPPARQPTWVDASIPRKPLLDWRELVINGLHYSGTFTLPAGFRKSHEIPPGGGWLWPRFRRVQNPKFVILCYHGNRESGDPLIALLLAKASSANAFSSPELSHRLFGGCVSGI